MSPAPRVKNPGEIGRTYSLAVKGETHTYGPFDAWQEMTYDQLCNVLSDLTEYRAEILAEKILPVRFNRLGYAEVKPANNMGNVPTFLIRSSDGGKP